MNYFLAVKDPVPRSPGKHLQKGGVGVGGLGEGGGQGPGTAACTVRFRLKVPLSTYV